MARAHGERHRATRRSQALYTGIVCLSVLTGLVLLLSACGRVPTQRNTLSSSAPANRQSRVAAPVDPGAYLGTEACAGCHPKEHRKHVLSPQALALHPATPAALGALTPPSGRIERSGYSIRSDADRIEFVGSEKSAKPNTLQLAFGSGKICNTYASVLPDGSLVEYRMSYAAHSNTWLTTPGQEHLYDSRAGRTYPPAGTRKCLGCHAVYVDPDKIVPDRRFFGVGCEACHGPGRAHVEAVKSGRSADLRMERIGTWGATKVNELCGRCHRTAKDINTPEMLRLTQRFQPYGLMLSKCFKQTGDTLSCLTCHDPHAGARTDAAYYEAICLKCHAGAAAAPGTTAGAKSGPACPKNPRTGCIPCHMPKRDIFEGVKIPTALADHYIRAKTFSSHRF